MADDQNSSSSLGGPATPTTAGSVNRDSSVSAPTSAERRADAAANVDNARAELLRQHAAQRRAQAELTAQRAQAAAERAQSSSVRQDLLEQGVTPSTVGAELAALRRDLGVPVVAPSSLARFLPNEQSRVAAVRSQQGYSERLEQTYKEAYLANVRSQEGAPQFLAAFVNKITGFSSEDIAALHHYAKDAEPDDRNAADATRSLFDSILQGRRYQAQPAQGVSARDFIATQLQYSAISQGVYNADPKSYYTLATLAMEQTGIAAGQQYDIVGDRPVLSPTQQLGLSAAVAAGQTSISAAALTGRAAAGTEVFGGLSGGGDAQALIASLQELVSTLRDNTQAVKSVPTLTALGGTNRQTQFRTAEDMLQYYRQTTGETIPVELLKAGGRAPQITLGNLEIAREVFSQIAGSAVNERTAPSLTPAQRITAQEQLQAFGESGLELLSSQEEILKRDQREEQEREREKQEEREQKEEERQQRAADQRQATADRQQQDRLAREQLALAREQQRRLTPRQHRPFEEMLHQQVEMEPVTYTDAEGGTQPIYVDAQGRIIRDMRTQTPRAFTDEEAGRRQGLPLNDPDFIAPLQRPKLDEAGNVSPAQEDRPSRFGRAYSFFQGMRGKGLLSTDKGEYQEINKAGMNLATYARTINAVGGAILGAAVGSGAGGGGGAVVGMLAGGRAGLYMGLAKAVSAPVAGTVLDAAGAGGFLEAVSGISMFGKFVAPQLKAMREAADTAAAMELPIAQAEYALQGSHNTQQYANVSETSKRNLMLAYELGLAPEKTIDSIKGVAQATGQQNFGRGVSVLNIGDMASLMRGGYDVVPLANAQAQSGLFLGGANKFNNPLETLRIFEARQQTGIPERTVSQVNELSQTVFGMSRARALRGLTPLTSNDYAGYAAGAGRGSEQVALSGIATSEQLSLSAGQQALSPLANAAQQVLFARAMQENKGDYFRAAEAVQNYTYEQQTAAFRAMGIDESLQRGMLQAAGMTRLTQDVLNRAAANKQRAMASKDIAADYSLTSSGRVSTDKGLAVSRSTSEEQRAASQRVYRGGEGAIEELIGRLDEVVVQTKVFQDQLVKDGIKKQDIQYLGERLTSINASVRDGFEGWANTVVRVAGAISARGDYGVDRSGTAAQTARGNSVAPRAPGGLY